MLMNNDQRQELNFLLLRLSFLLQRLDLLLRRLSFLLGRLYFLLRRLEFLLLSWFPHLDQKSSCLLQNMKLLKLHNPLVWQLVNLLQQRSLLPLPQVQPKQSLSQNPGALHLRDCSRLYLLWWRYIDLRI